MAPSSYSDDPLNKRLHKKIQAKLGSADQYPDLHHQVLEWIQHGGHAPPKIVTTVEGYFAGYLQRSKTIGMRWGVIRGVVTGILIAGILIAISLCWAKFR